MMLCLNNSSCLFLIQSCQAIILHYDIPYSLIQNAAHTMGVKLKLLKIILMSTLKKKLFCFKKQNLYKKKNIFSTMILIETFSIQRKVFIFGFTTGVYFKNILSYLKNHL